jgi:tetratricopeptide (TPR) repeat protein
MENARPNVSLATAIMVASVFQSMPTLAQTTQDWTNCLAGDLSTPDLPIEGCTAVIKTGDQLLRTLAAAYNNRGVAYRVKAKYAQAIDDFNEAIRLAPNYANAFNNRGVAYRNMSDLDRAVADYDQAILLKPDYVAAFYNRGLALADKKEYAKAISDFTAVLRVDPKNPAVLYRRGETYLNSGDIEAGNADLVEAKAIKPDIAEDDHWGGP